jgi:plasmid stabilization system protein ParE
MPYATMRIMNELIAQIRQASAAGLYYLALIGALALPDIFGALASKNGKASASKYKDWLRKNVRDEAADAELIYGLRCSLLHQGRAMPRAAFSRSPVPTLRRDRNSTTFRLW